MYERPHQCIAKRVQGAITLAQIEFDIFSITSKIARKINRLKQAKPKASNTTRSI
jgi:hypothetical protein